LGSSRYRGDSTEISVEILVNLKNKSTHKFNSIIVLFDPGNGDVTIWYQSL
jgi:hypothetical protein